MTGFLKLISAILWVLNYVRQNPKKSAVGATGLAGVTTAAMFYGAPGVPTNPPGLTVGGTPSDGDVPTWVDPTGPEWAAGGGGGGGDPIYTPDGTTEITRVTEFDPYNYGASGDIRNGTLDGSEASGQTNIEVDTGQGAYFADGNSVVIPGAGPAHDWQAETPDTPVIGNGGGTTFVCSTSSDIFFLRDPSSLSINAGNGYQAHIATGDGVVFYSTGTLPTVSGVALTQGTTYYLRVSTLADKYYSVHPTALDATNNTNAYNFDGAGSGVQTMARVGATSYSYYVVAGSPSGGKTIESAAGSTTTGHSTLCVAGYNTVSFPATEDGAGDDASWYEIYGRTAGSIRFLTVIHGAPNSMFVTFQAGGYTNFQPTDIGMPVSYGGTDRGTLESYNNTARTAVIKLYRDAETFPAASACSMNPGEGAGTVTGTSVPYYTWRDCGDSDSDYDYPTWVWRTGCEQQVVQISNTPTSGTYDLAWAGFRVSLAYNADQATVQAALRTIPGLSGVTVSSTGSAPNFKHTITFTDAGDYGLGNVPEIKALNLMAGAGTVHLNAWTTVQGTSHKAGDMILHPATTAGKFYEALSSNHYFAGGAAAPTFDTALNAVTADGRSLRWMQVPNGFRHVTPPGAATNDPYFGTISDVTGDNLTVTPATEATVADDTGVFKNDLPGFRAAYDAARANKGGVVKPTGRHFNLFARGIGEDDWRVTIQANTLFNLTSDPDARVEFDFNGATVRVRSTQTSGYRYDITAENPGTQSVFNLANGDRVRFQNGTIIYAPVAGPIPECVNTKSACGLFSASSGGSASDSFVSPQLSRMQIIGFPSGVGTVPTNSPASGVDPTYEDCVIWWGGGGHDPCLGSGKISRTRLIGMNGRHRSTAIYTQDGNDDSIELEGVHIREAGVDGLRIRNRDFRWNGGSLTNWHDSGLTTTMLIESSAANGKVSGVTFNTPNFASFQIAATGWSVDHCTFYNSPISAGGSVTIDGNTFWTNSWGLFSSFSAQSCISITGGESSHVIDNKIIGQDVYSATTILQDAVNGISVSGGTNLDLSGNNVRASGVSLMITSGFTSSARIEDNQFYSADLAFNSSNIGAVIQPGNAAYIQYRGNFWNSATEDDQVELSGSSSATHDVQGDVYGCEVVVASALTGSVMFRGARFQSSSSNVDFLDAGTLIHGCDFAIAPALTGAALNTRGNRLAGLNYTAVALAANQDNYAWPITDTVIFTTTGTNNYDITGVVARAPGSPIKAINGDAADNVTIKHDVTSTDANRFNINAGTDIVLGPDDAASFISTGGANTGWSQD